MVAAGSGRWQRRRRQGLKASVAGVQSCMQRAARMRRCWCWLRSAFLADKEGGTRPRANASARKARGDCLLPLNGRMGPAGSFPALAHRARVAQYEKRKTKSASPFVAIELPVSTTIYCNALQLS